MLEINDFNEPLAISVVIFTRNESRNIEDCIKSIINVSEIIVVDSNSSDDTCKIASDLGARIVHFDWNGKYPKKRQWSLENIAYANTWILFLDADERFTPELSDEIYNFLVKQNTNYSAASIPLDYYFAGRLLRYGHRPRKTVLLRIGSVEFPIVDDLQAKGMGELEGHYQPKVFGGIKRFESKITHADRDPISSWMQRHVKYAEWEAHLILNKKAKSDVEISKGKFASNLHKVPLRPFGFFVYSYIIKGGIFDGRAGFDYAFAKAWYYWLSELIARERTLHDR